MERKEREAILDAEREREALRLKIKQTQNPEAKIQLKEKKPDGIARDGELVKKMKAEVEKLKREIQERQIRKQMEQMRTEIEANKLKLQLEFLHAEEQRLQEQKLLAQLANFEKAQKAADLMRRQIEKMKVVVGDVPGERFSILHFDDHEGWEELREGILTEYHHDSSSNLNEFPKMKGPNLRRKIKFQIRSKPFAFGAFRLAFQFMIPKSNERSVAKSLIGGLDIQAIQENIHVLSVAQHLANLFSENRCIRKKIRYISPRLIKFTNQNGEEDFLMVEELLDGEFVKWNNNADWAASNSKGATAQAFSHFSWHQTNQQMMVVDVQGVKLADKSYLLTDPAIHSLGGLFGESDFGEKGMELFFQSHQCNSICKALNLPQSPHQPTSSYEIAGTTPRVLHKRK